MKFGVREICDVVLRAKAKQQLGNRTFYKNEPVLYFDTLKTSSLEGAATTVYATGGRGNARLIAWEGERTLTFNMEDALLSPEGFAILSGAGLIEATESAPIYVHTTSQVEVKTANKIELPVIACWITDGVDDDGKPKAKAGGTPGTTNKAGEALTAVDYANDGADIFCMVLDGAGEVEVEPCIPAAVEYANGKTTITCVEAAQVGSVVLVDYYVKKTGNAKMIEITADKFAGNYYLEASTLFRRESDGVDMPAEFIIPNGKIQSNFNFAMASSGDPSTFSFVMDAFPDYTKFDKTKKVLAAIQIIESDTEGDEETRAACVVGE